MHPLGAGRSPTDELGKKRRMTQFILRPPVVPEHVSGLEELFHNFLSRSLFLTVIVLITHHNYALIFNIMSLIIKNF